MGNYNPHIPQILGQEWVAIQEQALTLTPRVNLLEVGHGFAVASNKTIQTTRFYLRNWPPDNATSQVILANVYRRGTAALTGPIQSTVIPCSLGTAAAGSYVLSGSAPTIASALFSPSDNAFVIVNTAFTPTIDLRFDTEAYLPQLIGKRILGIDFLYTYVEDEAGEGDLGTDLHMGITGNATVIVEGLAPTGTTVVFNDGVAIGRQTIGEVDYFWNAPSFGAEVLPWTPNRLRAFDNDSSLAARFISLSVTPNPPTANQSIWFGYAAIEVFFCEEQRIMFGGRAYGSGSRNYIQGANQITMRDLSDAANPVLTAGEYDLVLASAELSPPPHGNIYPELNQVRELYELPSHPPVRSIRPFPLYSSLGETFTSEETALLPQVSLHTSTGPVTEVHVYGRQAVAQVYGSVFAAQEIYDTPASGPASYPWVRYYARRFGNTTVPLKLSTTSAPISGSSVDLLPDDFDGLDEILDGWKEVTLRFDTPPTMGSGTNPQWRWTAAGELAASRWEVLGAYAPALSGAPFSPFNRVPSPHQLSIATYGAPVSGAPINLSWLPQYAPPVSAVVDDETADATLIFSVDFPTVTGFESSIQEQEVVGVGLDCGVEPCCIPSEISYVQLSWGIPANSGLGSDSFSRVEPAGSWGNADVGGAWALTGNDYSVNGSKGLITFSANTSSRFAFLNTGSINFDVQTDVTFENSVLTGLLRGGVIGRAIDNGTNYLASIDVTPTGVVSLTIDKRVSSSLTVLGTQIIGGLSGGDGATLTVRFVGYGIFLRAKVWKTGTPEPSSWAIETTDSSITAGTLSGIFARDESAVLGHVVSFDNFIVQPPGFWFGHYELQRMDTVTTDWQTIMKATNPGLITFNDYEARVGIESSYRIRAVDVYDFPGPWSSTVTATVTEPGVTIGCTGGHLLIFTSNEEQDGSINLAYSSVWEAGQSVEETFAFPESQFVQLQAMYNRDFFTAFRPTERGGEQFSRNLLVQAAAIAPETLADFTSLRDMAWANVSYICVRDEDGNRWFSTVLVPGGRVLRDRRLYMAPVEIIEVTDTPSEVNP